MTGCKISVCIPTYNYGSFLPETIESILSQNFTDFELLIIDNDSTDDTRSVVEGYARQDSRVRYLVNSHNVGMVENWNLCLTQARGSYIKFVFGDDVLASPETLGRMAALLDADESVALVASARKVIDLRSQVQAVWSDFPHSGIWQGTDAINRCLPEHKNLIGEPSVVMFRKAQAARGFLVNYRQIVDLEMWFHLLEQGALAYIDEPLCSFRKHDQQQTVQNEVSLPALSDFFHLYADYYGKDYVKMNPVIRRYEKLDGLYQIWKLYKKKKLGKADMRELIDRHHGFLSFMVQLPCYKALKPCLRMYRRLAGGAGSAGA